MNNTENIDEQIQSIMGVSCYYAKYFSQEGNRRKKSLPKLQECVAHTPNENHAETPSNLEKMQKMSLQDDKTLSPSAQKSFAGQNLDTDSLVLSGMRQDPRPDQVKFKPNHRFLKNYHKNQQVTKYIDVTECTTDTENLWILPGTGVKPRRCQDVLPLKKCDDCGQIYLYHGSCMTPACPDCSVKWRYKRTRKAVERLLSHKLTKKTRIMHCTVSIPPAQYHQLKTEQSIDTLTRVVYHFAETKGLNGGLCIFHPYRIKDEMKKELYDMFQKMKGTPDNPADSDLGEFGLWKTLLQLPNWRNYVYFAPHYHLLGASDYVLSGNKDESGNIVKWDKKTLLFKRIGDLHAPSDIIRCYMYLLSHLGIHTALQKHNIRWFGTLSNGNWSLRKATEKTRAYTLYLIRRELDNFRDIEGIPRDICNICGGRLTSILNYHACIGRFSKEKQEKLYFAYQWVTGAIPPPTNTDKVVWMIS